MSKYLLEIGVEELPYKFIPSACSQLKDAFAKLLNEQRIEYSSIETYATPRRLAVLIEDIQEKQPDITKSIKGPPARVAYNEDGTLSKAGEGFLKKQGLEEKDVCKKDDYLYAEVLQKGEATSEILSKEIPSLILKLQGPHFMRWADLNIKFSRPIRWIVSLMDNQIVPVVIENVESGTISRGHRFAENSEIEINSADSYFDDLRTVNVIVDQNERRKKILELVENKAKEINGVIKQDENLVDEVANIVEWPVPVLCEFDNDYLQVPDDVTVTVMKAHQRYFPIYSKEGELLNYFITIANYVGDSFDNIKVGNERVIKARLDDGKFFYDEDTKKKLIDRVEDLKGITFQKGLGTMYDKSLRLEKLSEYLASKIGYEQDKVTDIKRCATLCKADLLTNLVYEFTELEGAIGSNYALNDGENESVAIGIKEHYYPLGADSEIAKTIEGQIVGIVDKIDTIVTTFAVGKKPTGSADPLGIRRATLGVISTVLAIENDRAKTNISDLIKESINLVPIEIEDKQALQKDIEEFFIGRFEILSKEKFEYYIVDAVIGARNILADIKDASYRLNIVNSLIKNKHFDKFNEAANRIIRIIKDTSFDNLDINTSLLKHESESQLYNCAIGIDDSSLSYEKLIEELFKIEPAISKFFDDVLVMDKDEEVKQNRLKLLESLKIKFTRIADFSKIVC